jgi:aryl-alcohol dehydrogenase-like predicted oxidoreductase
VRSANLTCGTQNFHDSDAITAHIETCLSRLGTDYIDAFFLEYVECGEEKTVIDAIRWWGCTSY